ncbi:MAG: CoA transferase [Chloroflexi bacterium]|nr:CoA transferase [Chloroflexota bacterium]
MAKPTPPLAGIRVLDLGRYQAGPRAALMFARLGAEVIKVEAPGGDTSRENGPRVRGQSIYWAQYNSGKKSITLDLRNDQAKQVLRDLVKVSDVLIQNFRPGVMDEMGFGYEALRSINKRIVMINVSAYGQDGVYRDRVGFDPIGQAMSGLMSVTGYPGTPPTKSYATVIDRVTALHATIGALAALRERDRSGEGQAIDVSLADTGFTLMEIPLAAYLDGGIEAKREGNRGGLSPSNAYQCSDGWAYIMGSFSPMWVRVCKVIGREDWLTDPRFKTRQARAERDAEIDATVGAWCKTRTVREVVDAFSAESIPAAAVNDIPGAAKEPNLLQREVLVEVPDAVAGKIHVAGRMVHFSRTPMVVGSTPTIGQHTDEVLRDVLQYTPARIAELRRAKAL